MTTAGPGGRGAGARRIDVAVQVAPIVFVVLAEAAWVSIAAGLVGEYTLSEANPGLPAMTAVVAAGVAAAWLGGQVAGRRWPTAAAVLAIVAGAAGWLAPAEVRAALSERGLAVALGLNPAGWLVGVALVRGFRHARLPLDESALATLLAVGVPAIVAAAVAGGMIAEPFRGRFLFETLVASIVFTGSGTFGLALARLTAVGADAGFDWRRNPPWLALAAILVVAAVAIAVPAASVAGPIITLTIGILAGPFLVVAFILGFTRRAAALMAVAAGVTVAWIALAQLFAGDPAAPPPVIGPGSGSLPAQPGDEVVAVAGVALVVAAALTALLVRLWMSRSRPEDADPAESRSIDRGQAGARPGRRRRRWFRGRRPDPVDAVSAYRALDEDLRASGFRRLPDETPAEHAQRLRSRGVSRLSLDLLAADYALVRFGEVTLSEAENRRAVGRWRALRRDLATRAGGSGGGR